MPAYFDYDPYDEFEEAKEEAKQEKRERHFEFVKSKVEETIAERKVVTDRELKVRLEKDIFPWITGRALNAMVREGIVRRVGFVGRKTKGKRIPESFFTLYGTEYNKIVARLEEKREISRDINAQLTAHAIAGTHAENLFEKAFGELGFKILGRNMSKFRGKEVKARVEDRQPPDLDFIITKDNVYYGVDIKNWIKYEAATRFDVIKKVKCALDLEVTPFIIARYVDKDTIYNEIFKKGGICYPYGTLLFPPSLDSLADKARDLLGYPILALDTLPKYKVSWIDKLHEDNIRRKGN